MDETINFYCGYVANMKPIQAGRVTNQLDKLIQWTDKKTGECRVANYATFIAWKIFNEGYLPNMEIQTEGMKYEDTSRGRELVWGTFDKPKTIYQLDNSEARCYSEINKTQYDFAIWLAKSFESYDEAIFADETEKERLQIIQEEQERKEREQREKEEKARIEKENFENYCYCEAKKLLGTKAESIRRELFEKIYADDKYVKDRINDTENIIRSMRLYIYAKNIENPFAKERLCSWLHNDNKASIKLFSIYSGVKMPKTYKERKAVINGLKQSDINLMEL